jgi:hypothetical protein
MQANVLFCFVLFLAFEHAYALPPDVPSTNLKKKDIFLQKCKHVLRILVYISMCVVFCTANCEALV